MSTPPTQAPTEDGRCHRCQQCRPLFPADSSWGDVPDWLCARCWSRYAEARADGTFVDFRDAFDNATDEELYCGLEKTL